MLAIIKGSSLVIGLDNQGLIDVIRVKVVLSHSVANGTSGNINLLFLINIIGGIIVILRIVICFRIGKWVI